MNLRTVSVCLAVAALAFSLGLAFAQEGEGPGAGAGMGMPAWMNPTKQHEELKASTGDFTVKAEMWMAPEQPPMAFEGTAKRESILNGRYVRETFKCNMMGMPMEGLLIEGYDTLAKEYVSIWMDNMSPIPSLSRGTKKDGVLTMTGEAPDPMTGKMKKNRYTVEEDGDVSTMKMYDIADDGTESMSMKLVYTRKKE